MKNSGELPEQLHLEECRRYTVEQMQAMSHYEISDLELSKRVRKLLIQNGCCTLDQAATFAEGDPIHGRRVSKKIADEIFLPLDNWINDHPLWKTRDTSTLMKFSDEQRKVFNAISSALKPIVGVSWYQVAGLVREEDDVPGGDQFLALSFGQQISLILTHPQMRSSLEFFWKEMMPPCGITEIRTIESKLACTSLEFDAQVLIRCSLETGIIGKIDGYYLMERETVSEYITSPEFDNKAGRILKMRFNGVTLEEIGERFGLSRERVRQLIASRIRKFPPLIEDYFAGPFQAFRFTRKEFRRLFPECSKDGFGYLSVRYGKGEEHLDQTSIGEYSGLWEDRLTDFVQEETESRKVLFGSSKEVIWSVLKDNIDHPLSMDLLKLKYGEKVDQMAQYIQDHNLERKPLRKIAAGTMTNFLRNEEGIVFNRENNVSFCDADPKVIFEEIDFSRYKNLVISSELIYRDYSEFMAEQHVRDGYELFYIIKNSLPDLWNGDFSIKCRRVPVIVFGEVSEADQAIRLLKEISPVSHTGYYTVFEQRYGIKKESAQGDPIIQQALKPYDTDGKYIFDTSADSEDK